MDKFKRVKKNKLNIVLEGLKHVQAKVWSKAKRNDKRIEQYRINRLFQQYQKVCTKGCVEKLKVVTYLTQEKARDFGTTFRVQERATKKMLNGWKY